MKKYNITESKIFCMAPWVHLFNLPNGDIQPCCVSLNGPVGNLYQTDVKDIWNNEEYKKIRQDMLADRPSPHCTRCYKEEEWGNPGTLRKQFNADFSDQYDELVTDNTGHASQLSLLRWDFRFSNLCNLACIGCSPEYSSTWAALKKTMDPGFKEIQFKDSKQSKDKFVNIIKTQAGQVKKVYFAGGEPLIQPEHYEILEEIKNLNRLDQIDFTYSTNLTTLDYKSTNIIDYWSKMKKLRVLVSIDEVTVDRLHYIRYPSDLNKLVENIKLLNSRLTNIGQDWVITPTWSIMNMHRMKEILNFFLENDLLPHTFYNSYIWEYDVHNIILMGPERLAVSGAPEEWKKHIHLKLDEYKDWYIATLIPLKNKELQRHSINVITTTIDRFHKAVDETNNTTKDDRLNWITTLDNARSTNFIDTFPELELIIKDTHELAGTT